ncbi:unnamed protein product [Moneuplotes crassus]|uniref:Uncharacterized protein n=1 Tax=Euplotes crassus TaxID=5936 RepID=A0AAD2DA50_EUPCR|nr:unnamed protein product [Moneuplotes crassus]
MNKNTNPLKDYIYVKIKKDSDTYFIACDKKDPVQGLKARLFSMIKTAGKLPKDAEDFEAKDILLYIKDRSLEDHSSCYDQQVVNNCVLHMDY